MAILQISKIQQRAGNLVDLPQLDEAEFGWATDDKRLFIGKTTPNENVEVLTGYSSIYFSQIDGAVGNLNITASSLAAGEVLVYDGASWVNRGGPAGGLVTLGSVANVKITGGTNTYYLQTDGTGNLSWAAGTGSVSGNGLPGGTLNQVQFNAGIATFGASSAFTFNSTSSTLSVTNITANGAGLTNIPAGNISGTVANATYATSAGTATTAATVTTNAQPNITSVGTLTSLAVTGNISGANLTGNHFGNGSALTAITGANVTGTVANATYAASAGTATTAGTVTTAAQPNITSVGTLTSLSVTGNITGANLIANSYTIRSVAPTVSAAGSTQSTATVLTKEINVVSTVASGANGVQLPAASPGMAIYITNTTANALSVYPASGAAIGSLSANAAFTQTGSGATIQFIAPTATQWYTVGATYA
jgi:hypothetical protein